MGIPSLDYGALMDRALRQVIARVMAQVAEHGLPDGHSFYITFPTEDEGVEMPDWLRAEHPESLSIVLQYEFYNFEADDERFAVDLSFRNRPARLRVPFRAITVFADPQAQFGLRFKNEDGSEAASDAEHGEAQDDACTTEEGADSDDSNVIPFDTFRR